MKNKAFTAVLTALLLTTPVTAMAAGADQPASYSLTKADKEKAIAKARSLLRDSVAQLKFVYAYYEASGRPNWFIRFTDTDPSLGSPKDSTSIMFDAQTGTVLSLDNQRAAWGANTGRPAADDARKAVDAYVQKYLPEQNLRFQAIGPVYDQNSMFLTYLQNVNGVPFLSNYALVRVDSKGNLLSLKYVSGGDTSKLPAPTDVISADAAQSRFSQDAKLNLHYVFNGTPRLVYEPAPLPAIDALTGDYVTPPAQQNEPIRLPGAGWQTVATSPQEAQNIFVRLTGRDPREMILMNQNLPDMTKGQSWTLNWITKTNEFAGLEAMFDPATYRLHKLFNSTQTPWNAKSVLTLEQGRAKALAHLQHVLPAGENLLFPLTATDMSVPDPKDPNASYSLYPRIQFTFLSSYNGLPVTDQILTVVVDSVTGELMVLDLPAVQGDSLKLPRPEEALDAATVRAAYLKSHPVQLIYNHDGKLVYQADPVPTMRFIDALTGAEVHE